MTTENNILTWWKSLDENWKRVFLIQIQINTIKLKKIVILKKDLSDDEKKLYEKDDEFENYNNELKHIALKALLQSERIIIGSKSVFPIQNLNPLTQFKKLNEISFINCEIYDINSLDELKNLKKVNFSNVTIYTNSSLVFSNINDVFFHFEKSSIQPFSAKFE